MTGLLDRRTASDDATDDPLTVTTSDLTGLSGRPVVTLGGDDAAGIDEPIAEDGETVGFTLQKRSLFGGSLPATLPTTNIIAVGDDAVIVADATAFVALAADDEDQDDDEQITPPLRAGAGGDDVGAAEAPARLCDVRGRDVVAADTGEPVGRVDRLVVDPVSRTIGSIRLDNVSSDVRFLSWRDIVEFGEDAVTISTSEILRKPDGPREHGVRNDFRIRGKPVLTDTGMQLGEVQDLEFDRADGRVTLLLLADGQVAGNRLRGVGPYAVVVAA